MIHKIGFQQVDATTFDRLCVWETWEESEAALFPPTSSSPQVLLVEADPARPVSIERALRDEGYTLRVASSLEQALALIRVQPFEILLADLSVGTARQLFNILKPFKERIRPIKLGVVTNVSISADEADDQGVAFALPRPLAVERLLAEVAISLHKALTPEQKRQARVVEHFFEALTREERNALSLCTEDMVYFAPRSGASPLPQAITGKAALGSLLQVLRRSYQTFRLEVQNIYSRPRGLAVRYNLCWAEPNGSWEMEPGALLMQFTGDRIRQIGLRADIH